MRVGFAGAGSMAAAMARGWAGAGEGSPAAMTFCDLDRGRAQRLADEVGGETRDGLRALAGDSDVLVLAVKPPALDSVADELAGHAAALISVIAATPLARLEAAFGTVPTIRVMPNQPVEVRRGLLCHPPPAHAPDDLAARLLAMLETLGTLVPLPEQAIEAAMAVMSCSPAYVAAFAEALAGAGARSGLDARLSAELVAETLAGTAALLGVHDPQAIRRAVAPPGGATEAGLEALERGKFVATIEDAVSASLERFR